MSYTKQNWQTGDTITAEKLNHMEDGISGGVLVVLITVGPPESDEQDPALTADVPFETVKNALLSGKFVVFTFNGMPAPSSVNAVLERENTEIHFSVDYNDMTARFVYTNQGVHIDK